MKILRELDVFWQRSLDDINKAVKELIREKPYLKESDFSFDVKFNYDSASVRISYYDRETSAETKERLLKERRDAKAREERDLTELNRLQKIYGKKTIK